MCLLTWRPKDVEITDEQYLNGAKDNPDGFGVAYVEDNLLKIEKGFINEDKDGKKLLGFLRNREGFGAMLIHFRKASSGMDVDQANCHPFAIDTIGSFELEDGTARYQFAIGHNGKLSYPNTKTKSDTHCFVEDVLTPLFRYYPDFLDNNPGIWMLEKIVGDSNKLLILRLDRKEKVLDHYIINPSGNFGEKKAHWLGDVWFSNYSYLPPKPPTTIVHHQAYSTGNQSSFTQMDKEYNAALLQRSPFAVPDENGWFWSFALDCWNNKNTGACCDWLTTRRERPYYIRVRKPDSLFNNDLNSEIKEAEQPPATGHGDPDFLDDDAWRAAYGKEKSNVIALEGGLDVQVPRDDSNEEPSGFRDMAHLDKFEKKILRRACADYCKRQVAKKSDLKGLTSSDMIDWVHSDLKAASSAFELIAKEWIDRMIVRRVQAGSQIEDIIAAAANSTVTP